jgi:hypothetical protein
VGNCCRYAQAWGSSTINRNMTNLNNNHSHEYYKSTPMLFIFLAAIPPLQANIHKLFDLIVRSEDVYEGQHAC